MKKFKKLASIALTASFMMGILSSCGGNSSTANSEGLYYLNFKPEVAEVYAKIAEDYKEETGKTLKVETAASNQYEPTLKAELSKSDVPVLFQINGPIGYEAWKDYCLDMKDSKIYELLTDKSLAVTSNGGVYGIPYVVEGYGIIYNNSIMTTFFESDYNDTGLTSVDEIDNFDKLKTVVESMTSNKEELGIEGVFASTSLKEGENWRWQTHLSNIPFYYEFLEKASDKSPVMTGLESDEIEFQYNENFKNIFDLYIDNSITDRGLLSSKSVDESMGEFALGKVAMVQNGNWAYSQISGVDGNTVSEEDVKFMPIYTGMPNDTEQGLCIGTENYFAINSQVSEEKQQEAYDFLEWLFTSETGKNYVTNELGFIAPFSSFDDNEKPSDPLAKEILRWMETDTTSVPWVFAAYPSENFKSIFGNELLSYAQGSTEWNEVVEIVAEAWATEKSLTSDAK